MANPLAGLTGHSTLEVRTIPEIAAVGVHLGAEAIALGRAVGHEVGAMTAPANRLGTRSPATARSGPALHPRLAL
jgi:hypothetical protein